MGYAIFFLLMMFTLGGILIYFGVKLRLHPRWYYKFFGVVLIFAGVASGSHGVKAFIGRYNDEKELDRLNVAMDEAIKVEAARRRDATPAVPTLEIRVDSGTGCQYLIAPNGSLAPRHDSTGKQVCR